jgi:dienelactone hydrolase
LLWTGAPLTLPVDAAAQTSAPVPPLDAPNPAQPGPQTVAFLCYGQGGDRWSDTCAADVELVTEPVDGSALVAGWSALRTAYWGFGPQAMPRNGRVWYPTGDGPFPLVLMVHGAADMEKPSDAGYGYLGELLASRGFIAVSVDQNFLNFSQFADLLFFNTLEEENDARAWLLLEHLAQWRTWNEQPGNPFHGKVDMGKIALIGHSRGGEAVAIAAAFNQLPVYPDDATLTFDYGFDIRAVAAIAPTDGFYTPANVGTPLRNVNYFVLQGAHDMDVATFMGARQYARAEFAPGEPRQFKAALYVFGANHGQFNTVWGRKDVDEPAARLFNLRQLLLAAEQQQIAQVYIAAFLETTLRDEPAYLPLFQDHRHAGDWLPETIYLNQYADSFTRWISTYEEDIDLASATLPGGSQAGRNLTIWREQIVPGRWQTMENKAVYLGWDASTNSEAAAYTIRLPEQGLDVNVGSTLVFDLAAAREHPDPDADDAAASEEIPSEPIDLTVAVLDQEGNTARLPLSHFAPLQPPLEAQVTKAEFLYVLPTSEAVFQSFAFPLAAFTEVNPAFTPAELAELRLVFDRTPRGVIILDNVGVRRSG